MSLLFPHVGWRLLTLLLAVASAPVASDVAAVDACGADDEGRSAQSACLLSVSPGVVSRGVPLESPPGGGQETDERNREASEEDEVLGALGAPEGGEVGEEGHSAFLLAETAEELLGHAVPAWKDGEITCNKACRSKKGKARSDCYRRCRYDNVPLPILVMEGECKDQCYAKHPVKKEAQACGKPCRVRAEAGYTAGGLKVPEWQTSYWACKSNSTFTGASPAVRAGKVGCHWETVRKKRNDCGSDCYYAVPAVVRVYKMECEDLCRKEGRTGWQNTQDCWRQAKERVARDAIIHDSLNNGTNGSGGGGGGASSQALQNLARQFLEYKEEVNKKFDQQVSGARQALTGLMHAQWSAEESVRQAGGTGITKARIYREGSKSYHVGSFSTPAMASSHNHANGFNTVGLGEFAAVMNGVTFRTRHNDYSLKQPSRTSAAYHAVEDIERPPVPKSVSGQPTLEKQIIEMREYFKAFKEQNVSHRDYRPYFKPTLCYLEGAWEDLAGDDLVEPFESDRHHIAATGWADLVDKVRFFDISGGKDTLENIPWLPTAVMEMDVKDGAVKPRLAKWSYRILCHPVSGDVETARIHLVRDSHVRLQRQNRFSTVEAFYSRDARFKIDPRLSIGNVRDHPDTEVVVGRNYLDLLMEQIPGKDNYPANLTDGILNPTTSRLEPFPENDPKRASRGTAIQKQHTAGPLNVGYYSRYFSSASDAMGRLNYKRGFNDPALWASMTTHTQIANVSMIKSGSRIRPGEVCLQEDGTPCPRISQRWTYAMPVELIYLSPLFEWNPHGIPTAEARSDPPPTGSGTEQDPFSGAAKKSFFFRTPAGFYGSCDGGVDEPPDTADTDRSTVYVRDKAGKPQQVKASGLSLATSCIPGVGKARLRYNIMPVHEEGASAWKEVKALQQLIEERLVPQAPEPEPEPEPDTMLDLKLTGGAADHEHEVTLTAAQVADLRRGVDVWVTSSNVESHEHQVQLSSQTDASDQSEHGWVYVLDNCWTGGVPNGKLHVCKDGHSTLEVEQQRTDLKTR